MTKLMRISPVAKLNSRELRRSMTDAEQQLWSVLRKQQIEGFKFRRQHPLGKFIVDFVCLEAKLIIEVDGGQHLEQAERDEWRTAWLNEQGFKVLRFWNHDVLKDTDVVKEVIWQALCSSALPPS